MSNPSDVATVRVRSFTTLDPEAAPAGEPARARGRYFGVELWHAAGADTAIAVESAHEVIVLLPAVAAAIGGDSAPCAAPARSVCVVPPGCHVVRPATIGAVVVIRADPDEVPGFDRIEDRPELDVPVAYRRVVGVGEVAVHPFDELPGAGTGGRLRIVQSDLLSINWVEYDGARNRTALSPHAHDRFEQGSLALAGDFVHHLRVPWGPDAELWRDDEHLYAPSPSLLVIPVCTEHTSEGVGEGAHVLIDIFSPPRVDFVARGMVANAHHYVAPEEPVRTPRRTR